MKRILFVCVILVSASCSKDTSSIPEEIVLNQINKKEEALKSGLGIDYKLYSKYIQEPDVDGLLRFMNVHELDNTIDIEEIKTLTLTTEGKFILLSELTDLLLRKYSNCVDMDCFSVQTKNVDGKIFFFLAHLNCDSSFKIKSKEVNVQYESGLPFVEDDEIGKFDSVVFEYSLNEYDLKYLYKDNE